MSSKSGDWSGMFRTAFLALPEGNESPYIISKGAYGLMQGPGKTALRERFLRLRQTYPAKLAAAASARIREKLLELAEVRAARSVLLYLSAKGEVDTWPLLDRLPAENRSVLAPRCRPGEPGLMDIHQIRSRADIAPGAFGLMEPRPDTPFCPSAPDVILLPALAFDRRGFRLGFGGGYYDRFLASVDAPVLIIGLAYDFQITDALPVEPWDRPADIVLTPEFSITRHFREDS